jgi:hypothetical protein
MTEVLSIKILIENEICGLQSLQVDGMSRDKSPVKLPLVEQHAHTGIQQTFHLGPAITVKADSSTVKR